MNFLVKVIEAYEILGNKHDFLNYREININHTQPKTKFVYAKIS